MTRIRFNTLKRVMNELDYEIENTAEGVSRGMNRNIQAISILINSLNYRGLVKKVNKKEWLRTNKLKNPKCFSSRKGDFCFLTDKGLKVKLAIRDIIQEVDSEWLL